MTRPQATMILAIARPALLATLISASVGNAQVAADAASKSVTPGERMKASIYETMPGAGRRFAWVHGAFHSFNQDSLHLSTPGDGHLTLSLSDIIEVRVPRGRSHPYALDMFRSALVGGAVGALAALVDRGVSANCEVLNTANSDTRFCGPHRALRSSYVWAGAGIGATIGWAIARRGHDRWVLVTPKALSALAR